MSEIHRKRVLDEEDDFYVLPKQDPRIETSIQRQAVALQENAESNKEHQSQQNIVLLCRSTARIFADPEAVANDIIGGDPFRSLRSCVVYKDLEEEEEDEENGFVWPVFPDEEGYEGPEEDEDEDEEDEDDYPASMLASDDDDEPLVHA